jgi:signal transduction histidine kinase
MKPAKVATALKERKEALEQQKATAAILRALSKSSGDPRPIFDAIVANLLRLFGSRFAAVELVRDGRIEMAAYRGPAVDKVLASYPRPFDDQTVAGRSMRRRSVIQMQPVRGNAKAPPGTLRNARIAGFDSIIAAPMLRKGKVVGALVTAHREAKVFDARQVALIKSFADQAVIAIENARLFNETKEALEHQRASGDIHGTITGSMADTRPVFDAIARNALRLFDTCYAAVFLLEGEMLNLATVHGDGAFVRRLGGSYKKFRDSFPQPVDYSGVTGIAVRTGKVAQIAPIIGNPRATPRAVALAKAFGYDAMVIQPLVRGGKVIGIIGTNRREAKPFNERELRLLKTFADQAVIAIENARLFNETKEALEQQTATAEILKVISESPTNTQPVFEAIVQSGLRLFPNAAVAVVLPAGNEMHMVAVATQDPEQAARWRARFQTPLSRERIHGTAILDSKLVDLPDAEAEVDGPLGPGIRNFLTSGNRAITAMPMMRGDRAIGVISVIREAPGPLSEKQLALLRTFAAQAVIAIENARLFNETKEALERQTATADILKVISSSPTAVKPVFDAIVESAVRLCGARFGRIYRYDGSLIQMVASHGLSASGLAHVQSLFPRPAAAETIAGAVILERRPRFVRDLLHDDTVPALSRQMMAALETRSQVTVPMLRGGESIGAVTIGWAEPDGFEDKQVLLLQTFADQAVIAIENVRLFKEIQEKSRQLEEASRHKSHFLASMSHELRTPLNAILGFNEMILGQVYGEVPGDMQEPLKDIQTSGKHLLRLINNVLDLAKIEAGRMELALADYSVQDMVESVRATLRPLAAEKGLEFHARVPADLPLAHGDGGRLTQCLMNLAGNSLKFTKAGRVEIGVAQENGVIRFHVADTGIGIPPEKIGGLFTEFKQTDATIASEYGGTGLGLSITKKFVEMHGGRIWVESAVGKGSTFIFEVPVRVGA